MVFSDSTVLDIFYGNLVTDHLRFSAFAIWPPQEWSLQQRRCEIILRMHWDVKLPKSNKKAHIEWVWWLPILYLYISAQLRWWNLPKKNEIEITIKWILKKILYYKCNDWSRFGLFSIVVILALNILNVKLNLYWSLSPYFFGNLVNFWLLKIKKSKNSL